MALLGRWGARVAVAVMAGFVLLAGLAPAPASADGVGRVNEADMTLLIGLRQAALWQIPAARMAVEKGGTAKVRQAGEKIAAGESQLDQRTGDVVGKVGAAVSTAPTAEQQGVLDRLQTAEGGQFDQLFVSSLREAYGFFYTVIGEVRSSTRVALVRQLADQANVSVMGYMQVLETTGLVRYQSLAPAAIPPAQDLSTLGMAQANAGISAPVSMTVLWMLAIGAAGLAAITGLRILSKRRELADPRRR
jgi:predicted outer membrane protein